MIHNIRIHKIAFDRKVSIKANRYFHWKNDLAYYLWINNTEKMQLNVDNTYLPLNMRSKWMTAVLPKYASGIWKKSQLLEFIGHCYQRLLEINTVGSKRTLMRKCKLLIGLLIGLSCYNCFWIRNYLFIRLSQYYICGTSHDYRFQYFFNVV